MMVGASPAPVQSSASLDQRTLTLPHLPTKGIPIDPNHVNHLGGGGFKSAGGSEVEGVIRVGTEYQAEIPQYCSNEVERATEHGAMVMWCPHPQLSDKKLEEYLLISKERFGYSVEQALGMLLWHGYDFENSLADLSNFEPLKDEWTCEEKVLFEQAFNLYGKTFQKIRQTLPDKPISALVKYYYGWKKLRFKSSQLDKQSKKTVDEGKKANGHDADMDDFPDDVNSEGGSGSSRVKADGGRDALMSNGDVSMEESERICSNCHVRCETGDDGDATTSFSSSSTSTSELCYACLQHLRRTGEKRVVNESEFRKTPYSHQKPHHRLHGQTEPPRGMRVTEKDLSLLTTESPSNVETVFETVFKQLDTDVEALKRQIQKNKQITAAGKMEIDGRAEVDIDDPVVNSRSNTVKSNRWTNEELLLAVQGVRQYGLDFKAIAEVIGNKTDAHIRSFYNNYKRRYNLESVLEEFKQAKAEQAVVGREVEVPLFASSTSPLRRCVKKTELVDNRESVIDGNVKPAISTEFQNQTSSASNIKPSVIKIEVSNQNSLTQPTTSGSASPVSVVIPFVSPIPYSSLSPASLQPSVHPPTSLSAAPRAQSVHIPTAHHHPGSPNAPIPLPSQTAHSHAPVPVPSFPKAPTSLLSHPPVPHLPTGRPPPPAPPPPAPPPPAPPPKAHLPGSILPPSHLTNIQLPAAAAAAAAAPLNDHHSSLSHPPPAHTSLARPQALSSRSILPSSFPRDHNLNKTEREPRGSQVDGPSSHFASPSASGGHASLQPLVSRTSVSSSSISSSSSSSSSFNGYRPSANSMTPNHSTILPSTGHPAGSGHIQPSSIHFGHLAPTPPLTTHHPPPSSSHNPAYLPPHHALAAASINSASSSGSLIRPHLPSLGQTHPYSPASVVPLGASPFINRPIPSPQNNLVRPGAPILFNSHSAVPGHTRSSGMD